MKHLLISMSLIISRNEFNGIKAE